MSIAVWILLGVSALAGLWFFVIPWVPPLYSRYREWLQQKASGK